MTKVDHDVKDLSLAGRGRLKVEYAGMEMPVLELIRDRFEREKPLAGLRMAGCLHITSETANLAITLKAGGANLVLCASNPLSTQDDVAAALVAEYGVPTYAIKGEDSGGEHSTYYRHIQACIAHKPRLTMDDGADLVSVLHKSYPELLPGVLGGTEETTTGVIRLRAMANAGALKFPVLAVNDSDTKHLFDNRYGTGQSTVDGIIRATNLLLAGKMFVVAGYGWCGRGLAMRARGMGAIVVITEVDPVRALEASMDGFLVMPIAEACKRADIIVTATGDLHVVDDAHYALMKDGAVLANTGHFNVEINIAALEKRAVGRRKVRDFVEEFTLPDGRRLFLLGEGRLINLAAAEGHPASVMDMSFANQALGAEYMLQNAGGLKPQVYTLPAEIDREIARLKLKAMGIGIDVLTPEQAKYLQSWEEGT
jgi:adenosylhomocysteinase